MAASDPPDAWSSAELLNQAAAGNEAAESEIFARYAERLTGLARSRLAAKLAARIEAEDIVQSAYRSFFVAAREGRFECNRGGDLWRLLVELTLHKLYRSALHHLAQQRSVEREWPVDGNSGHLWNLVGREPTPEEALTAAEELEAVLQELNARDRQALELRLQGYELAEIADQLHCNERTARRAVNEARRIITARGGGSFVPRAARQLPSSPVSGSSKHPRLRISKAEAALQWNDYVLREQIGLGASGRVYRATRKSDGQEFAIKFLRKSLTHNESALRRFLAEAKTVAALSHPGIVAIHGTGQTPGGGLFLLLDHMRGGDLNRIREGKAISVQEAIRWIAAAAAAVEFMHSRGVIHCDLKPSNLLLDEAGQIRVTDFGFAIREAENPRPGSVLAGTPAFMAPEQVDSSWGQLSPRTDVWGLGSVLFFLLYGLPPHEGTDVASTLASVASNQPVTFATMKSESDCSDLLALLARCLEKNPGTRLESAGIMAQALRSINV